MLRSTARLLKNTSYRIANAAVGSQTTSGRPIFIAGNGRSGTSWLGATLGLADNTLYYREPCHPERNGHRCDAADQIWSQHVLPGEDNPFFAGKLDQAFQGWFWRGSGFKITDYVHRIGRRPRIIIKDVATFSSTTWVADRWDPDVVLIFRHPGAYAASVRRLDQNNRELNRMRLLLQNPYVRGSISDTTYESCVAITDPLAASIASWALRTRLVFDDIKTHPNWHLIHYEELAADPVSMFQALYEDLGLEWTDKIAQTIKATSNANADGKFSTSRVSLTRINGWKKELTSDDVATVRRTLDLFDMPIYAAPSNWTGPFAD